MQLINISLLLAASLASSVQGRHGVQPHLHPRQNGNETYPAVSTVVVSPLPVSMPMATGVSLVEDTLTTKVTNATLTYTMGSGSSATVVTTTVLRSETLTRTLTIYATNGVGGAAAAQSSGGVGYNKAATSDVAGTNAEPTTTITDRSTTTRTVTVESAGPSGGTGGSMGSSMVAGNGGSMGSSMVAGNGGSMGNSMVAGNGGAAGSGCAAVATVTETIKSTITVTATPVAPSSQVAPADFSSSSSSTTTTIPSLPISSIAPAPYQNGTIAHSSAANAKKPMKKKECNTSGFLTRAKPTGAAASAYRRRRV